MMCTDRQSKIDHMSCKDREKYGLDRQKRRCHRTCGHVCNNDADEE